MTRSTWTIAAVLLVLLPAALAAHMKLAKSLPAADAVVAQPPAGVTIWFTQMPDSSVSKLALEGSSGTVKLGALTVGKDKSMSAPIEGAVADGVYTVSWQAAGDDGHIQKGTFKFTVRQTR